MEFRRCPPFCRPKGCLRKDARIQLQCSISRYLLWQNWKQFFIFYFFTMIEVVDLEFKKFMQLQDAPFHPIQVSLPYNAVPLAPMGISARFSGVAATIRHLFSSVQHRCTLTLKSRGGNMIINKWTLVVSRLSSASFLPVEKCSPPVRKVFFCH